MKSQLFEEAIADAKAVRATALANAKSLLEEAFTPKLKSMLGAKLKEELGEDDAGEVVPSADAQPSDDVTVTSDEIDQILKELDSDIKEADGEDEGEEVPSADAPVAPEGDMAAPAAPDAPVVPAPDAAAVPAAPAVTPIEGLGDVKTVEAPALVVAPGQLPVAGAPAGGVPPVAPVGDAPVAPEGDSVDLGADVAGEDDEINLEELLAELNDVKEEAPTVVESKDDDNGEEKCDVDESKEHLAEALKTIEFLRDQLNEVNLLNAKLLYTNKIFKAHALNQGQKMKIIESFDLAKSVREVKLAFNNLSEALNFSKVKAPAKKAITEGFASQSVGTTKPVEKIVTAPVNEMASRFQKLAGIKK
jgi:hypothetical protein